jgi:hypothetical protein
MRSRLAAQRRLALFTAGVALLNFPLLGLWDTQATLFGLPLPVMCVFMLWAVLIAALALIERAHRGDRE